MTFKIYRCNDGQSLANSKLFYVKPGTLQYAKWLESDTSQNRIMDMQDNLWDMWTIYMGDDSNFYTVEYTYQDSHFGEAAMWARVERRR